MPTDTEKGDPSKQSRIDTFFKKNSNPSTNDPSETETLAQMAAPSRTDKLFAELNSAMDTSSSSAAQPFVFTAGGTNSMPPPPVPTVQKTRKYLCMQRPVFDVEREFDPEELEEDEMKAFMAKRKKDAKKYSEKPLSDHPGHTWVISELGMWFREKYFVEAQMRDQDKFGMHIYNDYTGYGMQEVIQNIVRPQIVLSRLDNLSTDITKLQSFADEFSKPGNGSPYTLWAHIEALNWLLCEDGIDNMSWNSMYFSSPDMINGANSYSVG
jgi:hypothetical protein